MITLAKVNSVQISPQVDRDHTDFSMGGRALRSAQWAKKITYEFTDDAGFIHQYQRLRDLMPISLCGGVDNVKKEDAFDAKSQVLVARKGLHCFAGGRLNISGPSQRQPMPVENYGIALAEFFSELKLKQCTFGEFSRFAILPEFQSDAALPEIVRSLVRRAIAEGVEYMFMTMPVAMAYDFQKAAELCGVRFEIRGDVKLSMPESYEGPHLTVSVMDLSPLMPVSSRMVDDALIAD